MLPTGVILENWISRILSAQLVVEMTVNSTSEFLHFRHLNSERTLFTVGGVKDFSSLLSHRGQVSTHDFVGCMRNIQLDDTELLTVSSTSEKLTTRTCRRAGSSLCATDTCSNGATCIDEWESYRCHCRSGFAGVRCEKGKFNIVCSRRSVEYLVNYSQLPNYR